MAMGDRIRVVDVALSARTAGSDAVYTYRADADSEPGRAHFVPLGARLELGYVTQVREIAPEELGFDPDRLRPLGPGVRGLDLPPPTMSMLLYAAEQYVCPVPVAIGVAIPPGARDRLVTIWETVDGSPRDVPLTPAQCEVLRAMAEQGGRLVDTKEKRIASGTLRALRLLKGKGLVTQAMSLAEPADRRRQASLLRLTADVDRVEEFLRRESRRKPAQALVLIEFQEAENAALSPHEIRALTGVTDQAIRALVTRGLLEPALVPEAPDRAIPTPNSFQAPAISAIVDAARARRSDTFLLYGVTGSGKTEVYLRAAAEALRLGRQVLFLVPEIALTAQVIGQLRERFGETVAVLHSTMSPRERLDAWRRVQVGEAAIVLGPRSALFAPVRDLGLVVMDEEHEASYKQESAPRYHAKRLAAYLAERHGCPLVLGSATPSVESFYEAKSGRIRLLELPTRIGGARLPTVEIVDLAREPRQGTPSMFSHRLREEMAATIEQGNQIILLLNRRAYSPSLVCRDCGYCPACERCSVALAFHRAEHRMRCHHCDYSIPAPDVCARCQGVRMLPLGAGVEKAMEALQSTFPGVACARLDRDAVRRKGALEAVLAGFRSGEFQVLVGTQMVAKGLHFPNVALVGVVVADIGLNIPDFRASERTFQLLAQVGGRAGRGTVPGRVIIQTFNPQHPAILAAQSHEYEDLYLRLKQERREAEYPPFVRLANVVVSSASRNVAIEASERLRDRLLEDLLPSQVLGPADCPLERLSGQWRRHVLVKWKEEEGAVDFESLRGVIGNDGVSLVIDVDPLTLL
jgi:primosomal protein N' (replication factor Y)